MILSIVTGNLGRDPSSRATDSGVNYVTFTVASSNGRDKPPTWVNVTAWRQLGDRCGQYLRKGSKVCVTGEMKARAWIGRDGTACCSMELEAMKVEFLSSRQEDEAAQPAADPETGYEQVDDEIPPF